MDKKALADFALELSKKLGIVTIDYVDEHFDKLNLPKRISPFVKLALTLIKSELAKSNGLVSDLHKYEIK